MTGGGFGGAVIALARRDGVAGLARSASLAFGKAGLPGPHVRTVIPGPEPAVTASHPPPGRQGTWLVTGEAGYIGAHVVHAMRDAGHDITVIDDLSSGHAGFVPADVRFIRGSILDRAALDEALEGPVDGVVHAAAFKYAGVSVTRPLHAYRQNVTGTATLLEAMADHQVAMIVYSSSAAVYGTPRAGLVTEATPTAPESPYGETKLVAEWLIRDQAVATPLRHTSLRYFNVAGSGVRGVRDTSPHNLVPLLLAALASGSRPKIFGDDYPTPDGTCIRDYVHVADVARAHVTAARRLATSLPVERAYNLGSGSGHPSRRS